VAPAVEAAALEVLVEITLEAMQHVDHLGEAGGFERQAGVDGALARAASKGTVFGAFLDSTFDRLGEAAMLAAIGLVFAREGNDVALVAAFAAVIGSFLVSYTRAKAEALGLRGDVGFGSRVERVVLISVGLALAPWGWLQWPIYVLAAMAWITVIQRILFVRRQLREIAAS